VGAAALLWFASYARYGLVVFDEGLLVNAAERVRSGQLPYSGFPTILAPGLYYLITGWFACTGQSLLALHWLWAVLHAVAVALLYCTARRIASWRAALLACGIALLAPGAPQKAPFMLVALAVLVPLLRWQETRRARFIWLAGSLAGIGSLFRQDVAFAAAAVSAVSIPIFARRRCLAPLAAFGAALGLTLAPFVAWLLTHTSVAEYLRQTVLEAAADCEDWGERAWDVLTLSDRRLDGAARFVTPLFGWIPLVAAGAASWSVLGRRAAPAGRPERSAWLVIAALDVLISHQVLRGDFAIRFLQCGWLNHVLVAALAARAWREGRKLLATATGLFLPALVAWVLLDPGSRKYGLEHTGSIAVRLEETASLHARGCRMKVPRETAAELQDLSRLLGDLTADGGTFFVMLHPPIAYHLADRPDPGPRVRMRPQDLAALERDEWRALRAGGMRYAVGIAAALRGEILEGFAAAFDGGIRRLQTIGRFTVWEVP
jgi:hypothetical protein